MVIPDPAAKLATMMERLMEHVDIPGEAAQLPGGESQGWQTAPDSVTQSAETSNNVLEVSTPWTYCPKLPGLRSCKAAGKPQPSGIRSPSPEGPLAAHCSKVKLYSISPVGGYKLPCRIGGVDLEFLLDTGVAVTLLRKEAWEKIANNFHKTPGLRPNPRLALVGADGSSLKTHGMVSLTMWLKEREIAVDVAIVSPLTTEGILGLDFLKAQRASINLECEELLLRAEGITLPLWQSTTRILADVEPMTVRVPKNISVPTYSELEVMAHLEEPALPGQTCILENALQKPAGVMVACALICPLSEEVPVRIINTTPEPALIYAGKRVATVEYAEAGGAMCSLKTGPANPDREISDEKEAILWELVNGSGSELTEEQKEMFHQLLVTYADVIVGSLSDLGRTNQLCHTINIGDNPPIHQSVRWLSPQRRSKVQQLLTDMLEDGIIENSTSP